MEQGEFQMTTDVNLTEIREKAQTAFRRDGIGHLMAGFSLALMGLFCFDHRQAWAIFWAVGIWYWIGEILRRQLTYPRVGEAKLPVDKRAAALTGLALLAVLVVAAAIDYSAYSSWGVFYWGIVLAAVAAVLACTRRSLLYAALAAIFLASGPVAWWLISLGVSGDKACAYQFWALAPILAAVGAGQLVLFLRRNPLPADRSPGENA